VTVTGKGKKGIDPIARTHLAMLGKEKRKKKRGREEDGWEK